MVYPLFLSFPFVSLPIHVTQSQQSGWCSCAPKESLKRGSFTPGALPEDKHEHHFPTYKILIQKAFVNSFLPLKESVLSGTLVPYLL